MTKQHHVFGDFLLVKRGAVQAKQHAPGRGEHNIWELNYIALGGGAGDGNIKTSVSRFHCASLNSLKDGNLSQEIVCVVCHKAEAALPLLTIRLNNVNSQFTN